MFSFNCPIMPLNHANLWIDYVGVPLAHVCVARNKFLVHLKSCLYWFLPFVLQWVGLTVIRIRCWVSVQALKINYFR